MGPTKTDGVDPAIFGYSDYLRDSVARLANRAAELEVAIDQVMEIIGDEDSAFQCQTTGRCHREHCPFCDIRKILRAACPNPRAV